MFIDFQIPELAERPEEELFRGLMDHFGGHMLPAMESGARGFQTAPRTRKHEFSTLDVIAFSLRGSEGRSLQAAWLSAWL